MSKAKTYRLLISRAFSLISMSTISNFTQPRSRPPHEINPKISNEVPANAWRVYRFNLENDCSEVLGERYSSHGDAVKAGLLLNAEVGLCSETVFGVIREDRIDDVLS